MFNDPAPQLQVFLYGHGRENAVPLNKMGNTLTQHLIRLEPLDRLPVVKHISLAGMQITVNGLKKG